MTARQFNHEIDRLAAEWAARSDAEALAPADRTALEAWLAADSRHLGAYAKAMAVLARIERARAVGPGFNALRSNKAPRRRLSRRQLVGSIAASIAALVAGSGVVWKILADKSYTTKIGETRVVPLVDGSVMTLNTYSRVLVRYTKERREIQLVHGEALFDVAKNKKRPFIVLAGDTQVRAVGTRFTVRVLDGQPVQVLVQEGVVEVKRLAVPVAAPVRVAANTRAVAPVDAPIVATPVAATEVVRDLSWQVGRIAFNNETLKDAAAEFARYSDTAIVIDDPAVANQTVTGLYVSNDPVGFSKSVAVALGLRVNVGDNEVTLSR
jgi:transmembrane sensor